MRDSSATPILQQHRPLSGRHVLIVFGTFFGVIFAVNAFFLLSALRTHTGVVAVEPYRKGLAYNDRIAASDQQIARGWSDVIAIDGDGGLSLALTDAQGAPLSGLYVAGNIGRPVTAREDVALTFEDRTTGRYHARGAPLATGAWIVTLEARRDATSKEPDYRIRRRLWVAR